MCLFVSTDDPKKLAVVVLLVPYLDSLSSTLYFVLCPSKLAEWLKMPLLELYLYSIYLLQYEIAVCN